MRGITETYKIHKRNQATHSRTLGGFALKGDLVMKNYFKKKKSKQQDLLHSICQCLQQINHSSDFIDREQADYQKRKKCLCSLLLDVKEDKLGRRVVKPF